MKIKMKTLLLPLICLALNGWLRRQGGSRFGGNDRHDGGQGCRQRYGRSH